MRQETNKNFQSFADRFTNIDKAIERILVLEQENEALKKKIQCCKSNIKALEQKHLANKIDIVGLPFVDNNKIVETVLTVLNKGVGVCVSESDIDDCYRKKIKSASGG